MSATNPQPPPKKRDPKKHIPAHSYFLLAKFNNDATRQQFLADPDLATGVQKILLAVARHHGELQQEARSYL